MIALLKLLGASTVIDCPGGTSTGLCQTGLPHNGDTNGALQIVANWTFGVLAGIAVLIIAISALRLIWAAREGDAQAIPRLRGTIIYTAVGLAVALLSDVIVGFVLGRI
jgi:hypothetical protein